KIQKQLNLLKKDLLKNEKLLFYNKAKIDVEMENKIAELTNEYNFQVLTVPHFKLQFYSNI
ncbi:MAG: hypothetical protein LUH05_06545, partial [Candidatus Gastranaerophilales bacterium]|nr:hypothetical protein [Candidatus Gastranaerophilales bacterium]